MQDTAVERSLRAQGLEGPVLVAISGGIDSVVLAHGLAAIHSGSVSLGHVNHGLRGAESEADEAFLRGFARDLGVRLLVRRVAPAELREGGPSRARPTLQEAARTLRYAALDEMAEEAGARRIATAHQADDQAETVLFRLLRGTGLDGLTGIPPVSPDGRILRPLLGVSRAEIEAHARAHGLTWREDASNQSDDYARNRLRRHWLPGLARDFNPRLLRSLGELAETLRGDAEWIEGQVAREAAARFQEEASCLRIEPKDWEALPDALALRLARRALRLMGGGRDVSRVHLRRMVAFFRTGRPGTAIELPGGLVLAHEGGSFRLSRAG